MFCKIKRLSILIILLSSIFGESPIYFKTALADNQQNMQLIKEEKIYRLFDKNKNDIFEASGVIYANGRFNVVFDNLSKVGIFNPSLSISSNNNILIKIKSGNTGFEGITYDADPGVYLLIIEALKRNDSFHSKVYSYDKDLVQLNDSWMNYHFQSENKGFEGLSHLRINNQEYLLGLCEGNDCEDGDISAVPGSGRIKVFTRKKKKWKKTASIRLPASINFEDYSGMDIHGSRLIIGSSEKLVGKK